MNSHEVFIHIHQGFFAGTGAIVRLPQCQWSKPDGYGKISQCITTTKHSKAKTVCIFLAIYCNMHLTACWRRGMGYILCILSPIYNAPLALLYCVWYSVIFNSTWTKSDCNGILLSSLHENSKLHGNLHIQIIHEKIFSHVFWHIWPWVRALMHKNGTEWKYTWLEYIYMYMYIVIDIICMCVYVCIKPEILI